MSKYICTNPHFPVNHGKYWSRYEDNYIRRSFAQGRSITKIAQDLGRTKESIRLRILGT